MERFKRKVTMSRRQLVLNLVLVFLLGLFVARLPSTLAQITGTGQPMDVFEDVRKLVERNYVDPPKPEVLAKGAITGLLEALDDPYAEYIPAEDAADFEKAMTGSFSGIGAEVQTRDGFLHIVSPLEDSPAWAAGILAGDKVVKVNGETTAGLSVDKCIKLITGPEGTMVTLDVVRGGIDMQFTIKRAKIVSKSVRGFRRGIDGTGHWEFLIDEASKIAYVRMSQFTPTSPMELAEALDAAEVKAGGGLGGLILDFRSNPGGFMDSAIAIADMFLDSGKIMSTKGRNFPEVIYQAEPNADGSPAPNFPIAVLVNSASASASEIVAGALQDNGRAIVIGTRTFGKGLVQGVQQLPHDRRASVKFTTQRYYLPSGRLIQRTDDSSEWGVDPSPGFFVPTTDQETLAWILRRRDWDILRKDGVLPQNKPGEPAPAMPPPLSEQHWNTPEWIDSEAKDKQLAAALRAMQGKLRGPDWTKATDASEQHGKLALAELRTLERARDRMTKEFARLDKRLETLESAASAGKAAPKLEDFWSDDLDLTGGMVDVRDKSGKVIAELKITGRDLERWLAFADLEMDKSKGASGGPTAGSAPDASPGTSSPNQTPPATNP